jgi:hypothetical protein
VAWLGSLKEPTALLVTRARGAHSSRHLALSALVKRLSSANDETDASIARWQHAIKNSALAQSLPAARLQMLAIPPSMMLAQRGRFGSVLADDGGESKLCKKKQVLIDKFDELLAKLGVNVKNANATMALYTKEFQDAMTAWLDANAKYRLALDQASEASKGAAFATDEYEKWMQTNKQAKKSLAEQTARHALQRTALLNEKELIRAIMRLIGVLHDVKATEKSIAAGGRDSVKDAETGVSDPYNIKVAQARAQLQSKVQELKRVAGSAAGQAKFSEKLAQIDQRLAVYSETEEVCVLCLSLFGRGASCAYNCLGGVARVVGPHRLAHACAQGHGRVQTLTGLHELDLVEGDRQASERLERLEPLDSNPVLV